MNKRIRLAILGSTGSIGKQTLEVVECYRDRFEIIALTTGRRVDVLMDQIRKYRPKYVYVASEEGREIIKRNSVGVELKEQDEIISSDEVDTVVIGIPGFDSVKPVIEAAKSGKKIAVASKEAILCGGGMLFSIAKATNAKIVPIDSEHSSLWRILARYGRKNIKRVYITASGGPFLNLQASELENVKAEEALKHPVWNMGKKITIDSANLMNKAFEVIEASYLFDIPAEIISVKIHPEAIVHSAVEYKDGTTVMAAHFPDMRIPIMYSLFHDEDFEVPFHVPHIWDRALRFLEPDVERFPSILLGWRCAKYPLSCVLVCADDVAVQLFLEGKIRFMDIFRIVERTVSHFEKIFESEPGKSRISCFEELYSLSEEVKKTSYKIAEEF